jgi:hypothetical protein
MILVAIVAATFSALLTRRAVIPIVAVTANLASILNDPGVVMPDVAPVTPAILSKHCSGTQSDQQKHSRNRAFHILVLLPPTAASTE